MANNIIKELKCRKCNATLQDNYISVGKVKYCIECHKNINLRKEINSFYKDNISETVVFSHLNRIINVLVNERNVKLDYILFTLKYIVKNNLILNYPNGLYYYIDNHKIKKEYKQYLSSDFKPIFDNIEVKSSDNINFKIKKENKSSLNDLLL